MNCPVCQTPVTDKSPCFPFCSERCRLVDLGKWLDGNYCIPVDPVSNDDDRSTPLSESDGD